MKRFMIGATYHQADWFTGGTATFEVIKNDGDMVEFSVRRYEVDGIHYGTEKFPINRNKETEYVVLYEYKGHKCLIRAIDIPETQEEWIARMTKKYNEQN